MYLHKCDMCEREVAWEEIWREVRLPRPSDPADMCCVLAGCGDCFPASESCRTPAEWQAYIESPEAVAAGHMWLS